MTKYQILAKWQGDKNNTYLPLESKPVTINTVNQKFIVTVTAGSNPVDLNGTSTLSVKVTNQVVLVNLV